MEETDGLILDKDGIRPGKVELTEDEAALAARHRRYKMPLVPLAVHSAGGLSVAWVLQDDIGDPAAILLYSKGQ